MEQYIINVVSHGKYAKVYGFYDTYEQASAALNTPLLQEVIEEGEVVFDIQQVNPPSDLERDFKEVDIPESSDTSSSGHSKSDTTKPHETPSHIADAINIIDLLNETHSLYDTP